MLKFGKKVSFRPLIVSLIMGLVIGFMFSDIFSSGSIGFIFGTAFFLLVFLGHYWRASSVLFNYWQVNDGTIKYNDVNNPDNVLLMMLLPLSSPLKSFSVKDIQSITVNGDLKQATTPMAVPFSGALGLFSSSIAIAKSQNSLDVVLKNGQKINLDYSRDFVYNPKETIEKLNKFLDSLNSVKIVNKANHNVSLGY
ncbi:hypothetical protein LKACC16343_01868 [Companilactobacillus bobalius]|uniref:Uncharacterized protein n=2 Tax=Companilactobacillus bobalius TaxID=2801451 RepID=A0A202FAC1_9LACO|nr:hypothetical protein ATN92_00705 [Companilactobacillus bobalius]OVE97378.1 hypothetical protein LKACC16343_01868 [Companilactobacillus bobalius]